MTENQKFPVPDYSQSIECALIYSGDKKEYPSLKKSINSIIKAASKTNKKVLINIYSPRNSFFNTLNEGSFSHIQCEDYVNKQGKFEISKKKNFIFESSSAEILIIMHTRICVHEDFFKNLIISDVRFGSPHVTTKNQSRYLDLCLYPKYKTPLLPHFGGKYMLNRYDHLLDFYIPYIDGGIIIFNREYVESPPFDNNLCWGDEEDVALAVDLEKKGIKPQWFSKILCTTQTIKIYENYSFIRAAYLKTLSFLIYLSNLLKIGTNYFLKK